MTSHSGYSGTPQARKLGLREGLRVVVVGRPAGWSFESVEQEHADVADPGDAGPDDASRVDVLLWFVPAASRLGRMPRLADRIFPAGALWVAWPRRAAGHVSDVNENLIRSTALGLGLVDVKVAAIDTDWSGLKLCWRRENRARPPERPERSERS